MKYNENFEGTKQLKKSRDRRETGAKKNLEQDQPIN